MKKNSRKVLSHVVFWLIMLLYYISSSWPFESDKFFLFERMFWKLIAQIILSYTLIELLIPFLFRKERRVLFICNSLVLIYLVYVIYTAIRCFYLLPKYPEIFSVRPPLVFEERITNVYAFLGNIPGLVFPVVLLVMYDYFKNQKEVSLLKEQKKTTELNLLKNQLNPHFLFNTLNNIYTLALKKADNTPEAIAKLSEILDYMLYRCKDDFVPIHNEIDLIHSYIALEKIRYGKRLDINFDHSTMEELKVAPLIFLTFIENAFKHGVSQELNTATVDISIREVEGNILFKIVNSIPELKQEPRKAERQSIGLANVRKQLDLLYGVDKYNLVIENSEKQYIVSLKLPSNAL